MKNELKNELKIKISILLLSILYALSFLILAVLSYIMMLPCWMFFFRNYPIVMWTAFAVTVFVMTVRMFYGLVKKFIDNAPKYGYYRKINPWSTL